MSERERGGNEFLHPSPSLAPPPSLSLFHFFFPPSLSWTRMLPQMVMMGIISYFFSGFVMVKIPLPLSLKFKGMTQRGIDLQTLDVSFVSSFSWYVLVSVGISGVMTLLMGRPSEINDAAAMEQQMKMGAGGPQGMDTPKLYAAEAEALNMVEHYSILDKAEERLLALYEDDE